jgi:hypothetical protein
MRPCSNCLNIFLALIAHGLQIQLELQMTYRRVLSVVVMNTYIRIQDAGYIQVISKKAVLEITLVLVCLYI